MGDEDGVDIGGQPTSGESTRAPHLSPDGRWWWDGAQWVPANQPAPPPAPATLRLSPDGRYQWNGQAWVPVVPTSSMARPAAPATRGSGSKTWLIVGLAIAGAVALFVAIGILAIASDSQHQDRVSAKSLASGGGVGDGLPGDQRDFLTAVADGQSAAEDANELQVVEARKARGKAMCAALSADLAVTGWTGVVEDVSTTLGGDGGVLAIEIAQDVAVQTWNNGASDIGEGTLIQPESPLWDSIIDLQEGDEVIFSGRFVPGKDCIKESSLLDENGLRTPDFIFKFKSVEQVN